MLVAAVRAAIDQDASMRQAQGRCCAASPTARRVSRHASAKCSLALAAGRLNKQIAADLGVVEQTVKFHRARIMERMQAKTVAELMHIAAQLEIGSAAPRDDAAGSPNKVSHKPRP